MLLDAGLITKPTISLEAGCTAKHENALRANMLEACGFYRDQHPAPTPCTYEDTLLVSEFSLIPCTHEDFFLVLSLIPCTNEDIYFLYSLFPIPCTDEETFFILLFN